MATQPDPQGEPGPLPPRPAAEGSGQARGRPALLTSFSFLASSKLMSSDLRSSFVCSIRLFICFTPLKAFLISLLMYLVPSVDISAGEGQGDRTR